ncbi:SDR family oxidoreductase [Herbiconiux sp.]|uniref:SDR family oxidoreductase n=1 Tax=Herbiconiux sp. TaxID=1871186 RepID=UPI0025C29C57|nr:SDR family oxidoreductase [Herbiconiux sp.]
MSVLVVGAHGVAGGAAAAHLSSMGRPVTTLGRRPVEPAPGDPAAIRSHLQADLLDPDSLPPESLSGITAVVYAGYAERAGFAETTELNERMLAGLLHALERDGAAPERFVLIGGDKSYGEHLGPYRTPAKESDPRLLGPILYNPQEDLVQGAAARFGWSWTVLRPDGIFGHSIGSPMNILTGIAAFATLSKEEGVPLRYPGSLAGWGALHQATDARILARAVGWALDAETARDEVFNVTNGDTFRWKHLWTDIAEFFDLPVGEPQPLDLAGQMRGQSARWRRLAERDGLRITELDDFVRWPFVQGWLDTGYDMVQSTVKIRIAGFGDAIDSHESLRDHLLQLRRHRFIPAN